MYALIYLSFLWLSVWSQNILIISNFNLETSVTQNNSQFLHLHCLLELVDLSFTMLSTSQVISVASYSERGNCDKFGSEALFSDWGSFTCRKSTTQDLRFYFPSKGSHTQDFYALKKSIDPGRDRTREPRIQRRVWQPLDHRGRDFLSISTGLKRPEKIPGAQDGGQESGFG